MNGHVTKPPIFSYPIRMPGLHRHMMIVIMILFCLNSALSSLGQECIGSCDALNLELSWNAEEFCVVEFEVTTPDTNSTWEGVEWILDGALVQSGGILQLDAEVVQSADSLLAVFPMDSVADACTCEIFLDLDAVVESVNWPCECHPFSTDFSVELSEPSACVPHQTTLVLTTVPLNSENLAYTWSVSGGAFDWAAGSGPTDSVPSILFLEATGYQIQVEVTELTGNGCSFSSVPAWFSFAGAPTVSIMDTPELCAADEVAVQVLVNPGNSAVTEFQWIFEGDTTSLVTPAPFVHQFDSAGQLAIEAWASNACGSGSDASSITVHPSPSIEVHSSHNWYCMGSYVDFTATGDGEFVWNSNADLLSGGQPGDTIARYAVGSQVAGSVYTMVDHGNVQCTASSGFSIYGFFVPTVSLSLDESVCVGEEVSIDANIVAFGWDTSVEWIIDGQPIDTTWAPTASVNASASFSISSDSLSLGDHTVEAAVIFDPYPVWLPDYGCADTAQYELSIHPLPSVSAVDSLTYCNQSYIETLPEGVPAGGVWTSTSGPVVENGLDPALFGLGEHLLAYTYTDAFGCVSTDTTVLEVAVPAYANAGPDSVLCESNDLVQLPMDGGANTGYWEGPGILDGNTGLLDLSDLDVGTWTLVYQMNSGSCMTVDSAVWQVLEEPTAFLSTEGSVACDGDTVWMDVFAGGGTVASGSSYSYEWTDLVTLNANGEAYWVANLNETFALVGVTVTDDLGCSDDAMTFISPMPLPEITIPALGQECAQDFEVQLPAASPLNGTWSGLGVQDSAGIFNPGQTGPGTIELVYTASNSLGCFNSDTASIQVIEAPEVTSAMAFTACVDAEPIALTGFAPEGGTWTGAVTVESGFPMLDPAEVGVGPQPIIYTAGSGSCAVSDTTYAEVRALPEVQVLSALGVCTGLTVDAEIWVNGGTAEASLIGISSTVVDTDSSWQFSAGPWGEAEVAQISAAVENEWGCATAVELNWTVHALPEITLPNEWAVCATDAAADLPAAWPEGGSWSGVGVGLTGLDATILTGSQALLSYAYTDSMSCTNEDSIWADLVLPPVLDLGPKLHVCTNDAFVALPTPFDLPGFWSGPGVATGQDTMSLAALEPGLFQVMYTHEGAVCSVVDSLEIEVHAEPLLMPVAPVVACPDSLVTFEVNVADGVAPFTFSWSIDGQMQDSDSSSVAVVWNESGTHVLSAIATDTHGCSSALEWNADVLEPIDASIAPSIALCNQSLVVELGDFTNVEPATAQYFTGLGAASVAVNSAGAMDLGSLLPGNYEVIVFFEPEAGCAALDTAMVQISAPIYIQTSGAASICAESGVQSLTAVPESASVTWAGLTAEASASVIDPMSGMVDVDVLNPGVYAFSVQTGEGTCATADTLELTVWALPEIAVPFLGAVCSNDDAVALPVPSPAGGSWSGAGVVDATTGLFDPQITGTGSAQLLYTFDDLATSCSASVQAELVVVSPQPAVIVVDALQCVEAPFTLAAGNSNLLAQAHWQANGQPIGNGLELDWVHDVPGSVEFELVTVDVNGCLDTTMQSVEIEAVPQVVLDDLEPSGCAPYEMVMGANTPVSEVQWSWYLNGEEVSSEAVFSTSLDAVEDTTYHIIEVEWAHACGSSSDVVSIGVLPAPTLDFSETPAHVCLGEETVLSIQTAFADEIVWNWGSTFSVSADSLEFIATTVGSENFTVAASSAETGCSSSGVWTVMVHGAPEVEITSDVNSGCSPLSVAFTTESNQPLVDWVWQFGDSGAYAEPQPTHVFEASSDAELVSIVLNVTDQWGCEGTASSSVEVFPQPSDAWELPEHEVCGVPTELQVQGSGEDETQWLVNHALVALGDSATLSLTDLGWNHISQIVSNAYGCEAMVLDSIEVLPLPNVQLTAAPMMGCVPLEVELTPNSNGVDLTLAVMRGNETIYSGAIETSFTLYEMGNYQFTLEGVSDRGCINQAVLSDSITVFPSPQVAFEPVPYAGTWEDPHPLNSSWTFENDSDSGQSIWDFGDGSVSSEWDGTHTFQEAGIYEVTLLVVNSFGCSDEAVATIEVEENLQVFVPTAFTPPTDGYSDGVNDAWRPEISAPELIDRYHMVIYNRYGQVVWETTDPTAYWIGEAHESSDYYAQNDVYTYVLRIDSRAQRPASREWRGHITLIR